MIFKHTQEVEKSELIESGIELIDFEDCIFNIYLCHETLNIWAKECCDNGREIQHRIKRFTEDEFTDLYKNNKANIEIAINLNKHKYLTYRLGRYTKDDEVTIGDIFMFGDYEPIGIYL